MTRAGRTQNELVTMPVADLVGLISLEGAVILADRTGVYVHAFKCRNCRLEFQLFSWLDDRHSASSVHCPECGSVGGGKLHWIATVNESTEFWSGSGREIFEISRHPRSILLDD